MALVWIAIAFAYGWLIILTAALAARAQEIARLAKRLGAMEHSQAARWKEVRQIKATLQHAERQALAALRLADTIQKERATERVAVTLRKDAFRRRMQELAEREKKEEAKP